MLTTLDKLKVALRLSTSTDDALLTDMLTDASAFIEAYLSRDLDSATRTYTFNGHDGSRIYLPNTPVTAVTSVTVNGTNIPAAPDSLSSGYLFDDAMVYLRGYCFTRGIQNCAIVYTAGYTAIPTDIGRAAIELVSLRYKELDRIGHKSKSIQGETVVFFTGDMPASVKTLLNQYKKVVPN